MQRFVITAAAVLLILSGCGTQETRDLVHVRARVDVVGAAAAAGVDASQIVTIGDETFAVRETDSRRTRLGRWPHPRRPARAWAAGP